MDPGDFEKLFRRISELLTLELISEEKDLEENFPKRNPETPIWDTIEALQPEGYIDLCNGRYTPYKNFFKGPVRILFFILISEFESRLFKISEWFGKDISELNEKNLNNLITDLLNSELTEQREYKSRKEFKEDLKAVSSFRNMIVHINKKLESNVDHETLIKRKSQILKLLSALQQILDRMEMRYERLLNDLTEEDLNALKASIRSLEESIKRIYISRRLRNLLGEDGIIYRTLGEDFLSPQKYKETYFDRKRGMNVKTEFAETIDALENFDENPSQRNKTTLFISFGDLLVQRLIINLYHKEHPSYKGIIEKINQAIEFLEKELEKRNLDLKIAKRLTEIKYGSRLWLSEKGLIVKDKKLEHSLCQEELEKLEKL